MAETIRRSSAVHFSSQRMDWPTPRGLFADLHAEFGFTLDVCATEANACLPRYLTEQDEALMCSWAGERVWCNPPYGTQIRRWMEKVWTEAPSAELIVALVPSRTDTVWWHEYAMPADEIRFLRGRLTFEGAVASAPFPSCLVVYRSQIPRPLDFLPLHPIASAPMRSTSSEARHRRPA